VITGVPPQPFDINQLHLVVAPSQMRSRHSCGRNCLPARRRLV